MADLTTVTTNYFATPKEGFTTTLASTISSGAATVPLNSITGYTNGAIITLVVDPTDAAKKQTFTGVVDTAGVQVTSVKWTEGTNQSHSTGATVVDYVTATHMAALVKGLTTSIDQDGTLKSGAVDVTAVIADGIITKAKFATAEKAVFDSGWSTKYGDTTFPAPNTVTALGNRSYTCVFNSVDLTGYLSNGMRLKLTRTVAAPTQCTSLNGTTQYYSRASASVAAITFTDDFVASAWVKLSSYPATQGAIISRWNGTSGWSLDVNANGSVTLFGTNGASGNSSYVVSYQSIPLNRWVHVAAQLDMSSFTATTTTSYIMFDGVDVPASVARGGTNPTTLVQAGNLEVGSRNGGTASLPGKIAQVALYSAKVTQATILASMNQTLTGSETSLLVAYSFNGVVTDLSANGYTLTANGSATATNADSPFAQGTGGSLEYGIVTGVSFSTNTTVTVQVPEGSAIPTSGGVSAVSYSNVKVPYGFPAQRWKWQIQTIGKTTTTKSSPTANTWYNDCGFLNMNIPIGSWNVTIQNAFGGYKNTALAMDAQSTFSTANNTESDSEFTTWVNNEGASATFGVRSTTHRAKSLDLSAATVYYLNHRTTTASAFEIAIYGTFAPNIITAENAYL